MNLDLLTQMPLKKRLYERETYFREGMRDALRVLGCDVGPILHRSALLLIKPDGVAAGKVAPVLRFLASHDLVTIGVHQPVFGRLLWREMWRYQLTAATLDRLLLNDLIYVGPSVLLLLRDKAGNGTPATVRLAQLKGSADLSKQQAGTLRQLLRQTNRNFSFIHVADEPADLVRELGLLLGPQDRDLALATLRDGGLTQADRERLAAIEAARPARPQTFEPGDAAAEALGALRRSWPSGAEQAAGRAEAIGKLEAFRRGQLADWAGLAAAVERSGVATGRWALAAIGASMIICDEPGQEKMLVNPDPSLWHAAPFTAATRDARMSPTMFADGSA